jgi:hypothetical protein
MTPLISEFAKITADAETWHWFDTGNAPEIVEAAFDAELFALPYPRTAFVGVDTDGSKFCVALIAGENHVSVAGRYDTGSFAAYIEPFSYLNTDEGLRIYGGNGKEPPPRAHYMPVIALITRFVQSLRKPAIAYVPTAKKSLINSTRATKGKGPILFDWHTVSIAPAQIKREHQGGSHASPRLHDRRGHWRSLRSGKQVWVKNCKVGDASKGVVFKDYKVIDAVERKVRGEE